MNEPLLKDAIDMHVHVTPDTKPRRYEFIDAALEAKNAGMKGLVFNYIILIVSVAILLSSIKESHV